MFTPMGPSMLIMRINGPMGVNIDVSTFLHHKSLHGARGTKERRVWVLFVWSVTITSTGTSKHLKFTHSSG